MTDLAGKVNTVDLDSGASLATIALRRDLPDPGAAATAAPAGLAE